MSWDEFKAGLTEIEVPLVDAYLELLKKVDPREVLEIGSGWGIFARTAMEMPNVVLTTIDKIPVSGRPDFNQRTAGFEKRIDRIVGESWSELPRLSENGCKFDFIFVDADHSFTGALDDMRDAWKLLQPGGVLMADDLFHKHNWNADTRTDDGFNYGTTRAFWEFIKGHTDEIASIKIMPVGHGVGVITKKNL